MPSTGATTSEPVIPTDLERQVKTTEEAITQEMVTLVTKGKEPMRPPSIETRTVETQKGNYLTIDMRNLEQLGRTEVLVRGLTEPVQVAPQSKPALGPAEVPGMVEVEVIQTAQATTSQTASLMVNQEPARGRPNGTWKTQEKGDDTPDRDSGDVQGSDDEGGENDAHQVRSDAPSIPERSGGNGKKGGHGKGKLIGKQPSKNGRKGKPKKKTATPAFSLVKRMINPGEVDYSTKDYV